MAEGWTNWRNFTIAEKRPESAIITSFILRPEDGKPVPRHKPGQHLTFLFPVTGKGDIQRNYTISTDANGEYYRISVKREPEGTVSKWLHDEAQPGTKIKVMPPSGQFFLADGQKRPVVFLSGGVGQTPMVAMTEAVADRYPDLRAHYVHAALNGEVHAFRDHINALAQQHGGVATTTFYADPKPGDICDHAGLVTMDWLKTNTPLAEADYFVCGPIPFLRAFVGGLAKAGVPQDRIHYEFFGDAEDLFDELDAAAANTAPAAPAPAQKNFARKQAGAITAEDIGLALIGSPSDAVVVADRAGNIILWNPGAERIFGFTEEEAVGQSLDIIIPEPFRARHWEGYHQTAATGVSRYGAGDLLAVPGLRKDGTRNSIEFTIVLLKDKDGKVEAMASVIRDVTKNFMAMKELKKQLADSSAGKT